MNEKYNLLKGKTIRNIESNKDGSELAITFTDNTTLWVEITEFSDNSILELVLFDGNDKIIEIIQEGYKRS
jgi:hypothetical protein